MSGNRAEDDYAAGLRLAYLTSLYPAPSSTFITNEVDGLRRRGHSIQMNSVRCPDPESLPPDLKHLSHEVTYLLPAGMSDLVGILAWAFLRAPIRCLATLAYALTRHATGLRGRVYMLFYFVEAMLLAGSLHRRGAQLLHVHHANTAAIVGMLAVRYLGIPFSFTAHGSDILLENHLLEEKLDQARFVVTVSDYNRTHLEDFHGDRLPRVEVVRTGVDLDRFKAPALRLERAMPRILSVGRLHEVKGFTHLVTALARVREMGLDFECALVGEGPDREAIGFRIHELGLEEHLHLAGAVGPEAMPPVYAGADIFVLPSLSEGLPVVLMEAMASGLPVVATRITGVPELVEDGVSGLLVPPAESEALAQALARLLSNPETRREMGRAGRRRVERGFDLEVHLDRLNHLFRKEMNGCIALSE